MMNPKNDDFNDDDWADAQAADETAQQARAIETFYKLEAVYQAAYKIGIKTLQLPAQWNCYISPADRNALRHALNLPTIHEE